MYTDIIARGLNLYTLLCCFITIQIAYVAGYTLFEVFGSVDDDVLYQRISITVMGYVTCVTSVL